MTTSVKVTLIGIGLTFAHAKSLNEHLTGTLEVLEVPNISRNRPNHPRKYHTQAASVLRIAFIGLLIGTYTHV